MDCWAENEQASLMESLRGLTWSAAARSVPIVSPKGIFSRVQRQGRRARETFNLRSNTVTNTAVEITHCCHDSPYIFHEH